MSAPAVAFPATKPQWRVRDFAGLLSDPVKRLHLHGQVGARTIRCPDTRGFVQWEMPPHWLLTWPAEYLFRDREQNDRRVRGCKGQLFWYSVIHSALCAV